MRKGRHVNNLRVKRGETSGLAKLTATIVRQMRAERRRTGTSFTKLGVKFRVSKGAARLACIGETWAHIK